MVFVFRLRALEECFRWSLGLDLLIVAERARGNPEEIES